MRFTNAILLTVLLLFSSHARAISCELTQFLSHPAVRDNVNFWEEFGSSGEMSDESFRQLLLKYNVEGVERRTVERAAGAPAPVPNGAPRFMMSKQATKDTRLLSAQRPALQRNLDEFLNYARDGAGSLRQQLMKNPGKWNYKKLEGRYGGEVSYSARLDGGVRVVFHQKENGLVEIIAVDNSTTH